MLAEPPGLGETGVAPSAPPNWLDAYPADAAVGDLYLTAAPSLAAKWRSLAAGLAAQGDGGFATAQEQLAKQIAELGLTFRIAGDEDEREWPLTAMPLILGGEEWARVERGLIQRATLIEAVAADIHGPQSLVAEGRLPPAVIAGSRYFARKMLGVKPQSDNFIHVYAADLARGPQGQWRILGDRLRLATGIGYALENRMAMSRLIDDLLSRMHVRRVADFFASLREGIARDCRRERPRIALLTPGRFNQSYPEQAHLARYLGFPLVEGRDLVVTDGRLYVRTIAGPKRIDAAWRWIDTNALDPLNFDSRSRIGVPGMFDAWVRGGAVMANWPGVEVLESPAFSAFLPRLCRLLLGEDLALPNVATWWCGQRNEAETVRARLDELLVVPAFDQPVEGLPQGLPVAGANLEEAGRHALIAAMRRRPMDYVGQEIINLSTTPALIEGRLAPRPFTIRAFVARGENGGWRVMPGGFARLSSSGKLLTSLMGAGDVSADVCIVDEVPMPRTRATVLSQEPRIWRGGGILASQAADNLYWFSRYNERAETTVRIVRSILGSSIEVDGSYARVPEVRASLVALLVGWEAISPEAARQPVAQSCGAALAEGELAGGVATLIRRGQQAGMSLRERFARDFWRIVRRPVPEVDTRHLQAMLTTAKGLIEHFGVLSGLIGENMVRGLSWRFLDMGRRLERGLAICRITRQLTALLEQADALGVLLDLCDSQIAYRSRYLTRPMRNPVLDLVLLDPANPRSLIFQVQRLNEHIAALPSLTEDNIPEPPLLAARAVLAQLETITAAEFTHEHLLDIEQRLLALSDTISARYFLQYERPESSPGDALLG
ncbi:MAG: circularly permuted type 2 ATP-grasp protein [Novosphingobium sp.]